MRLLHTKKFTLDISTGVQPYAILSHRWLADREEVSFQDLYTSVPPSEGLHDSHARPTFPSNVEGKQGFTKVRDACDQASRAGLEYIWIDTCCIDKTSSAELSEAINSMYAWYKDSAVCYVYLHDVDNDTAMDNLESALEKASWFRRGWTLQELIAPDNVYFFDKNWVKIGSKATFASMLHRITHIRKDILLGNPCTSSIAEKMSWAAKRETQKIEDRAYSLMGLFGIHMPIIYGEGEKAFRRLQLEIIKSSDDQTIFAWHDSLDHPHSIRDRGLLASTPDVFSASPYPVVNIDHSHFVNSLFRIAGSRSPLPDLPRGFSILNDGIHITLPMKQDRDAWLAVLKCKREDQESFYGIYLKKRLGSDDFLRTSPTKLRELEVRDLKGLALHKIRIVVDHHTPATIHRQQFFTFRSTDLVWERGYYICPDPGGHHDVNQGGGYRALDDDTRIELSNNVQCGCVYSVGLDGEVTVLLIGIEHHRPWVHLLTDTNIRQYVDTSRARRQTAPQPLFMSPPTSPQSNNQTDPISFLASSIPRSVSPSRIPPGPSSKQLQRRFTAPQAHAAQLRGGNTGCPVCSILQNCDIDMRALKASRADFVIGTISGKQIEVDIRKGQTCVSEEILKVDYVITLTVG